MLVWLFGFLIITSASALTLSVPNSYYSSLHTILQCPLVFLHCPVIRTCLSPCAFISQCVLNQPPTLPVFSGAQEKPHTCEICGAGYTYRRSLKKHLKIHTGETTCPMCKQAFSAMYALRRHLRVTHRFNQEAVDTITKRGAAVDLPASANMDD